ncbi:MAG: FtsX-like permease family protein [Verrucomicrobiales bacterium]|nr:ABC transporter permease [Verrucomicrobiae bacterium]
MTFGRLLLRGFQHYRGLHAAVLGGVLLTAAILSGALVVGDSVKESLRRNAAARLSKATSALVGGERFFTETLAGPVSGEVGSAVPLLHLEGTVSTRGGEARANRVQIVGVREDFWVLSEAGSAPAALTGGDWIAVNDILEARLGLQVGDRIVVRLEKPGALSKDAPLSGDSEATVPIAGAVTGVVDAGHFGRYGLRVEQVPPGTVFVPLAKLQALLDKPGKANVLLSTASAPDLQAAVEKSWTLDDAGLRISTGEADHASEIPQAGHVAPRWGNTPRLVGDRVFLDAAVQQKAVTLAGSDAAQPTLTYLVNTLRSGGRETPYSLVAATGPVANAIVPKDLGPGEIMVTQWLAEDLQVAAGGEVSLTYYTMGLGRQMREETAVFKVRDIVPMDAPDIDRSWTPDFPGLFDVEDMDGWEPGIPIDKSRVRPKDEKYWDDYRTTPKAFLSLEGGRRLWANRFGDATGVRFVPGPGHEPAALARALREQLTLNELALPVRALAAEARAGVADSFDFGQLFAYMSFFLIVAALLLTGLVFVFGVEQRAPQIGLLLAVGWRGSQVRRLFLTEAVLLAIVGATLGLGAGWVYTKLALWGMSGAWRSAASGIAFTYQAHPVSLLVAWVLSVALALGVVWFASRAATRIRPGQLIASGLDVPVPREAPPWLRSKAAWSGVLSLLAGVGCLVAPKTPGTMAEQGLFFGSGFLFTIAGLCGVGLVLRLIARKAGKSLTMGSLARRQSARRPGRSLAVVSLMASGVFLVTAINAFRLDGSRGAERRDSGTGGFAFVGESTLPIYEDLNLPANREKLGIPDASQAPWKVVAFRVSSGDDASCLNLNRAQRPRLMGVASSKLVQLGSFAFAGTAPVAAGASPWSLLQAPLEPTGEGRTVIPGIVDLNTATYALKKGLGDEISYEDASGTPYQVRIVGLLQTSLLQGSLIIEEEAFIRQHPAAGGYRFFLLDQADRDAATQTAATLTRQLGDRGLEMAPAARRLDEFNAVQNVYLSIFSTLGGLGVLLGTVGLGIVVGRNVLERRGELALMGAVGFTRQSLNALIVREHWMLHLAGVVIGIAAAIIAVLPKLNGGASGLPLGLLAVIDGGILLAGVVLCLLAARTALRGEMIRALREG